MPAPRLLSLSFAFPHPTAPETEGLGCPGWPWGSPRVGGCMGASAKLLAWQSHRSCLAAEPEMCQATLVPGLEFGGTELLLGVMEICLQMELLAQPSGSGRGLG